MNKATRALVVVFLLIASTMAHAQQSNPPLIGYLSRSSAAGQKFQIEAFRKGMRARRQIEGQTFSLAFRYADGNSDRVWALAEDLVRLKMGIV